MNLVESMCDIRLCHILLISTTMSSFLGAIIIFCYKNKTDI